MKKVWRMLLLAGVFTVLLCVSALAADPEASGIYDVTAVSGATVTPDGAKQESVTIGTSYTGAFYAGAEKVTLTYKGAESGSYYLVMLLDSAVVPTVSKIEAGDIAYIDQKPAEGTGETSTVEFTVYPSKLENGKTYKVYLSSNDVTLTTLTEQGSFSYYVPYTLGDVNDDGKIDLSDALLVLQYDAELIEFNSKQLLAANVTVPLYNDEIVNIVDVLRILQFDARIITAWDQVV